MRPASRVIWERRDGPPRPHTLRSLRRDLSDYLAPRASRNTAARRSTNAAAIRNGRELRTNDDDNG